MDIDAALDAALDARDAAASTARGAVRVRVASSEDAVAASGAVVRAMMAIGADDGRRGGGGGGGGGRGADVAPRALERAMSRAVAHVEELRAASKARYVDVATGMRLQYRVFGSDKRVVLILHDVGECAGVYYGLARALADRGYTAYAIDARGHGDSTRARERRYSARDMTDDIESFIIELDLYVRPVGIVGFGMGGVVATAMAERNPRLVATTVLVESSPLAPAGAYAFFPTQVAHFSSPETAVLSVLSPLLNADTPNRNITQVCKCALPALECVPGQGARWRMDPEFYFDSGGAIDDAWDALKRTTCHFALIHGEHSSYVSSDDAKRVVEFVRANGAKSARAYVIAGASRRVVEDAPGDVRDMIIYALMRADADLLIENKEPRRPEMLGIRPLPQYATIEDALKALQPRAPPSAEVVRAALAEASLDDECASDEDTTKFNNRTMLIQNDPEYFGFVG